MVEHISDEDLNDLRDQSTANFLARIDAICKKYEKSSSERRPFPVLDLMDYKIYKANKDKKTMNAQNDDESDYDLNDYFESDVDDYAGDSSEQTDDDNHSISLTSSRDSLVGEPDCFENSTNVGEKHPVDLHEHSKEFSEKLLACSTPSDKNSSNYNDMPIKNQMRSNDSRGVIVKLDNGNLFMNAIHEMKNKCTPSSYQRVQNQVENHSTRDEPYKNFPILKSRQHKSTMKRTKRSLERRNNIFQLSDEDDDVDLNGICKDRSLNCDESTTPLYKSKKQPQRKVHINDVGSLRQNAEQELDQKCPSTGFVNYTDQISLLEECKIGELCPPTADSNSKTARYKLKRSSNDYSKFPNC